MIEKLSFFRLRSNGIIKYCCLNEFVSALWKNTFTTITLLNTFFCVGGGGITPNLLVRLKTKFQKKENNNRLIRQQSIIQKICGHLFISSFNSAGSSTAFLVASTRNIEEMVELILFKNFICPNRQLWPMPVTHQLDCVPQRGYFRGTGWES